MDLVGQYLMPADLEAFKRRISSRESEEYKRFDEYLCHQVKNAQYKTFSVAPMTGISYEIRNQVLEDWRQAGWQARYTSDQREGDWITIGF